MKLLGVYLTNRKCFLPFVMLAAVLFISQGITVPNFPNPQEPKLSSTQKAKTSNSAVVNTQAKHSQYKTVKTAHFLALSCNSYNYKNLVGHISPPQNESQSFISAVIASIPARAPPA